MRATRGKAYLQASSISTAGRQPARPRNALCGESALARPGHCCGQAVPRPEISQACAHVPAVLCQYHIYPPHACIHKVSAEWPQPAVIDPQDCREGRVRTAWWVLVIHGALVPPNSSTSTIQLPFPWDFSRCKGVPVDYGKGITHGHSHGLGPHPLLDGQLFATGCAAFVSVPEK